MRFNEELERELAVLKGVHYTCVDFFNSKDHQGFADYIEAHIGAPVDISIYKTILIVSKAFKNHPISGPARAKIYKKYYEFMIEKDPDFHLYNPHPDDNV